MVARSLAVASSRCFGLVCGPASVVRWLCRLVSIGARGGRSKVMGKDMVVSVS